MYIQQTNGKNIGRVSVAELGMLIWCYNVLPVQCGKLARA